MNLERVNKERSVELSLPEGPILVNQMEYIVEVLMKFESILQLKTRTTPGNQESFTTKPKSVPKQPAEAEQAEYFEALQALIQDEIVEIDAAQKSPKLHYKSGQNVINLPAIVGCLNWIALRTCPDIAWATSCATSLITHDPDTCFTHVKHICQSSGICPAICSNTSGDQAQIVGPRRCLLCTNRGEESTRTDRISWIISENKNGGTSFNGAQAHKI